MTTYDIEVLRGNGFKGALFTVAVNGTPLDLTGAQIEMFVRVEADKPPILASLALGSGLTITNAAAGEFRLDPQVFPMAAGVFVYDIKITNGGIPNTYVGGTIRVLSVATWT